MHIKQFTNFSIDLGAQRRFLLRHQQAVIADDCSSIRDQPLPRVETIQKCDLLLFWFFEAAKRCFVLPACSCLRSLAGGGEARGLAHGLARCELTLFVCLARLTFLELVHLDISVF